MLVSRIAAARTAMMISAGTRWEVNNSFESSVVAPLRLATDKGAADCARTGAPDIEIASAAAIKDFEKRIR